MTETELCALNIGENLDQLMNIDPRGYGVCRILYPAARKYAGGPVALHAAEKLCFLLKKASKQTIVAVMSGFILRPHLQPETDGITGALLFIRALVKAFNITPLLLIPEKNLPAVLACAPLLGLHVYNQINTSMMMPYSFAYTLIPVDKTASDKITAELVQQIKPAALFSTETAGANSQGEYHNALGVNMTDIEAKQDGLFDGWKRKGVPTFAVGDLGNEVGMGALSLQIKKYIPFTGGEDVCNCGCTDGILAATKADYVVTATVSDWGVYAVIAAIAFLTKNIEIMHDEKMEERVLEECCKNGMVDMTGALIPSIDGFDVEMEKQIVSLMRSTTAYAIQYCSPVWFKAVLKRKYYEKPSN